MNALKRFTRHTEMQEIRFAAAFTFPHICGFDTGVLELIYDKLPEDWNSDIVLICGCGCKRTGYVKLQYLLKCYSKSVTWIWVIWTFKFLGKRNPQVCHWISSWQHYRHNERATSDCTIWTTASHFRMIPTTFTFILQLTLQWKCSAFIVFFYIYQWRTRLNKLRFRLAHRFTFCQWYKQHPLILIDTPVQEHLDKRFKLAMLLLRCLIELWWLFICISLLIQVLYVRTFAPAWCEFICKGLVTYVHW